LSAVAAKIKATSPDRTGVIAGDLQDAESMKATLDLFSALGVKNIDCRQDGAKLGGARESYLFNTTIAGLEACDAILLVGTNPRKEAPLVNARIRKTWLKGKLSVGVIGERCDLHYDHDYLGAGADSLKRLIAGEGDFAHVLNNAKAPAIIVGQGALTGSDGAAVLNLVAQAAQTFGMVKAKTDDAPAHNGFNVLHTAAARVAGLDMGFVPAAGGKDVGQMLVAAQAGEMDVVFLLGADEIDTSKLGSAFVVYLGSHGDAGANRADVILPGSAYTEKPGLYVNTEGRVQIASRAIFPKGEAKEDWAILRALSDHLGVKLGYDSLEQLRGKLMADHPTFGAVDYAPGAASAGGFDLAAVGVKGEVGDQPFASPVDDFYLTNPIARASVTMAECSAALAASHGRLQAAE
jgi:NADH-quinone oxidoreductase subunit G